MQERIADPETLRSGAQSENRAIVAGNGPLPSAARFAASAAKRVTAPARAADRGPLDIVFASTATILLWVVIVALVKWLS